jgi:predicted Zn-dependent protease
VRAAHQAAYGRDMEREADEGGQILAAAAGYDPRAMASFLGTLGQMTLLMAGTPRYPTFFDTHPGTRERVAANAVRAAEIRWQRDPALGDTRAALLHRIDGLALGERPEAGVFEGARFLHPDLDFQVLFPEGWETANTNQAVGATAPGGDAVVYLSGDLPPGPARESLRAWVAHEQAAQDYAIRVVDEGPVRLGELDAWRMELEMSTGRGSVVAWMTAFPYRGAGWRIVGMARGPVASSYRGRVLATARSFRPLTPAQRGAFTATRLRVVTAQPGETMEALCRRTDSAWNASRAGVANGLTATHRFEGGELVKIARVEPYTPRGAR